MNVTLVAVACGVLLAAGCVADATPTSTESAVSADGTDLQTNAMEEGLAEATVGGKKCKCPNQCPAIEPPLECAPDEHRCKSRSFCSFLFVCEDGTLLGCSAKGRLESCVPRGEPCGNP